jgi:hypothetical protein
MQIEIFFNGTPDDFGVMVREFAEKVKEKEPLAPYWHPGVLTGYKPGTNPQRFFIHIGEDDPYSPASIVAMIVAHNLPGGRAHLRFSVDDDNWEGVKPYWDELLEGIKRQGWIIGDGDALPQKVSAKVVYAPIRDSTKNKHKKVYREILRLREEYNKAFQDGSTKNPDVSVDDIRVALRNAHWNPSEKTIRKIMKEGDEGLLT